MSRRLELRNLPLRTQLMVIFLLLAVITTAVSTVVLQSMSWYRLNEGLRSKSNQYAQQLQLQLETVVAFDDKLSARELFQALASDHDVDGLAVYAADGKLIEGRGSFPPSIRSVDAPISAGAGHVITVANVKALEGPTGRLYVSLSTDAIVQLQRREAKIAAAVGVGIILCALLLAVQTSRRMAVRLVDIAAAAKRMSSGDFSQPPLDAFGKDEIGAVARAFNKMVSELSRLAQEREQMVATERDRLEHLVLERTKALHESREMFRLMTESTQAIPFTLDLNLGSFTYVGPQAIAETGITQAQWSEPGMLEKALPRASNSEIRDIFDQCGNGHFECETVVNLFNSRAAEMRWVGTCEITTESKVFRGLMRDITHLRTLERDLLASQKLESVGRLAAGVAHEINTPVQFVADNVHFVTSSVADIAAAISAYRELRSTVQSGGDVQAAAQFAEQTDKSVDLDYIMENLPPALSSAGDGLNRIAVIVRSMKEFAHPDQAQKSFVDLNQAIQSTLIISNNEFKYVADLETQLGELPPVECFAGELNQVLLNLIINAAHAIGDVVRGTVNRGKITVRTSVQGQEVEVAISDTGTGIPESARAKVFDPFFTTKEVGVGTGQGLSISHNVVVGKHGGSLRFETECGVGTTFFIRIPIKAPVESADQVAA